MGAPSSKHRPETKNWSPRRRTSTTGVSIAAITSCLWGRVSRKIVYACNCLLKTPTTTTEIIMWGRPHQLAACKIQLQFKSRCSCMAHMKSQRISGNMTMVAKGDQTKTEPCSSMRVSSPPSGSQATTTTKRTNCNRQHLNSKRWILTLIIIRRPNITEWISKPLRWMTSATSIMFWMSKLTSTRDLPLSSNTNTTTSTLCPRSTLTQFLPSLATTTRLSLHCLSPTTSMCNRPSALRLNSCSNSWKLANWRNSLVKLCKQVSKMSTCLRYWIRKLISFLHTTFQLSRWGIWNAWKKLV